MATEMQQGVRVGTLEQVERESPRVVSAGGRTVVLIAYEGRVFALDNRCPHMGFPQGLSALRSGNVTKGTRLVVYGASGSLGTAAVQFARHLGAHVTAVCTTTNVELVRSLGADEVVDYLREDFTTNGQVYDVVIDAVGKYAYTKCRSSLRPGGIFVATDRLRNLVLRYWTRWFDSRKVVFRVEWPTRDDLLFYKRLIEAGEYRAVVDRTYPLEDVVEATRYVESWQKTGNVVLTVG